MTRIKICGIKTEEHALTAAEAGADFIGLIFASSPRQITPGQAGKIVAAVRRSKTFSMEVVGVFVNTPVQVVNRIADYCGLDYVQLSGDENFDYCQELTPAVIKVMRVGRYDREEQVCEGLTNWSRVLGGRKYVFLLDSYDPVRYGGTGEPLDRGIAKAVASKFNVIIAGGLTPDNVALAIKEIRPWGVDVSSGVETDGEKDMNKIKAFIKTVRDTDAVLA
jgi:phosphoribosylanthranilate isomerase